ncbi:MAG: hypothetical protein GOV15_00295, partial [Candidatus Diapherotrites archaeon]|nr:hypothetical protein [Candidatus Diapherotrites archaeon]
AYAETEKQIHELLSEINEEDLTNMPTTELEDKTPFGLLLTPELYAGYSFALPRGQNLGNTEGMQAGNTHDYAVPAIIKDDVIYLHGQWKSNPDDLQAQDDDESAIILSFIGKAAHIVIQPKTEETIEMDVFIFDRYLTPDEAGDDVQFDGTRSFVVVDQPRVYNVVRGEHGRRTLTLTTTSKNFSFSAFTFG